MPTPQTLRERDIALCRSILYEALSVGFRPPTAPALARVGSPEGAAALADAASAIDDERGTELAASTRALAASRDSGDPAALSAVFARLFGPTARGAVPPYETEYGPDTLFQKPQEMSDIAGFLRAFSLVLDPVARERIDHVSCELEFLAFLARKEAHALEVRDEPMCEETRRATRGFLKDHLGRFAPSFARRLQREDAGGFYGSLGALLQELVREECERFAVPAGNEMLRLGDPVEDAAPIACGSGDGPGSERPSDSLLAIGPPGGEEGP